MAPNLFILGAGKCGTSSLHAFLGQHPEIHASRIKEPTFFCWPFQVVRDPIEYFKLFDTTKRYRMESSHAYFSNPATAPVLKDLFPLARFIVILRNPKARAYSLYRHMRRPRAESDPRPFEDTPMFPQALEVEDERFQSMEFARHCPQYFWNFMYCRSSLFDEQLQRYFTLFDRRQFHILTLAEMVSDPVRTIDAIISFLGLDRSPIVQLAFPALNDGGAHEPYGAEAEAIMDRVFDRLTERVDGLVGRGLDWSL